MYPRLKIGFFLKIKPNKFELCNPTKLPNGNLNINTTAFDIFSLCNGENSINEIVNNLSDKYYESKENLEKYVLDFLDNSVKNNLLDYLKVPSFNSQDYIKGNNQIYYPDVISWEITNFCPLNCMHCYLKEKTTKALNIEEINKVIDIIAKSGIRMIQITGGDPLTHPNLEYILKKLTDMKITIILLTSGVQYTEKILKVLSILKSVPNSAVRVSLDGNESYHNAVRRNSNAFTNTVNFIKKLRAIEVPCQISTTAIKQSEYELEELASFVKSLGVYYMEIGQLISEGNAYKNNLKSAYNSENLYTVLNRLNEKYADNSFQIKRFFKNPDEIKKCGAGTQVIYISSNLDIKPCPAINLKLGNLYEETFEKIMIKSTNLFSNIITPNIKICHGCKFESDCKSCTAQALSKNKSLVKKCEWYKKYNNYFSAFCLC